MNPATEFREAIQAAGLPPPEVIHADGKLHRFSSNGKPGDDAGWYVLHGDGIPAGSYGDWRDGSSQTWRADIGRKLTPAEDAENRAKIETQRKEREAEEAKRHKEAAKKAAELWKAATPARPDHPYLTRKRVAPVPTLRELDAEHAARILCYPPKAKDAALMGRLLVAPVKIGDNLSTVELIDGDGRKAALAGGAKAGGYWATQPLPATTETLLVGEGAATVLSASAATGYPGIAALSSSNLVAVAKTMRERYPAAALVILADLVKATGAPDSHAVEAARSVGGKLAIPGFGTDRDPGMKDMNDLAVLCGAEAVQRAIAGAGDADGWPEPQPLTVKVEPEPYPIDALPVIIRAAVDEVQGFVKAPVPLVASSALAALSLACQAHIDAKRAERLHGPVSLFMLTIADSGERKSTCDGFFTSAIREYQEKQSNELKPEISKREAEIAAWKAERDGILAAIKQARKDGETTDTLRDALAELQSEEPATLRVPKLLLGDETPENLAYTLAKNWPSAGVMSSEAGVVFGSHGMNQENAMRNLGLLNTLWDGGSHSVGRRTSESFTVRGARLTMGLMVQEQTLRDYLAKVGPLARGSGFLARFMVAWPRSTQGTRFFEEAPQDWPHLAAFNRRIGDILNQGLLLGEDGGLSPTVLPLAPKAKAAWKAFHDVIEKQLGTGGELHAVKDVASKTADNAVRLAALFHKLCDAGGDIGLEAFEGASRIAAWHLSESQRFFGELALPAELADAARLDAWLIEHCRLERTHIVGKNYVRQHGPLRDGNRLDAAIKELDALDRLRLDKDGKRLTIRLNPALVGVAP
jgi:putative DNA primase/helicase